MDILALPDVFLRRLMRTMTIKDRLRLRRTCHALADLVADTNAGEYDRCEILFCDGPDDIESMLLLIIDGVQRFSGLESSDEGFEIFINLIDRLFSGITFKVVHVELSDHDSPPEYVRRIVEKFSIGLLRFNVFCEPQLGSIQQIIADHPSSSYTMNICCNIFPLQESFYRTFPGINRIFPIALPVS